MKLYGVDETGLYEEPTPEQRRKLQEREIATNPISKLHNLPVPPLDESFISANGDEFQEILNRYKLGGKESLSSEELTRVNSAADAIPQIDSFVQMSDILRDQIEAQEEEARLAEQQQTEEDIPEGQNYFNKMTTITAVNDAIEGTFNQFKGFDDAVTLGLLATGEHIVNTAKDLAFLMTKTTEEISSDPEFKMPERPQTYQILSEIMRESQTTTGNLASGAVQFAPYIVPVAGQLMFATDIAKNPEMLVDMVGMTVDAFKNTGLAIAGNETAIESIRKHPFETALALAMVPLIALGVKGRMKGKSSPKSQVKDIQTKLAKNEATKPVADAMAKISETLEADYKVAVIDEGIAKPPKVSESIEKVKKPMEDISLEAPSQEGLPKQPAEIAKKPTAEPVVTEVKVKTTKETADALKALGETPEGKPQLLLPEGQTFQLGKSRQLSRKDLKVPPNAKEFRPESNKPVPAEATFSQMVEHEIKRNDPKQPTGLYPILEESTYKKGKFAPATDEQLIRFAGANKELWKDLGTVDKNTVRKEYNKQRTLQKNEKLLDQQLEKEHGIEPDLKLKEEIQRPPAEVPDISKVNDISRVAVNLRDPVRNLEASMPKEISEIFVNDLFDQKGKYTDKVIERQNRHVKEIETDIGVKPGSQMDIDVQLFGEGIVNLKEITKKHGAEKAGKIVKAAEWYRARYEELLKEVNRAISYLEPGDPSKLIKRRQDYFHHFRDLGEIANLLEIVEGPSGLYSFPEKAANFVKLKGKKPGFIKRRLGNKTDISASAGYIDYILQAAYTTEINPYIQRMRRFANKLDKAMTEYKGDKVIKNDLQNTRQFLNEWINGMSGTPHGVDVAIRGVLGKSYDLINWANRRGKQNTILGNFGTVLSQFGNVPNASADMGYVNYAKGASITMAELMVGSDLKGWSSLPMSKSKWMQERYLGTKTNQYKFGMVNSAKKSAAWLLSAADEIATKGIFNGYYQKAISEGIKNPIRYAERNTQKMVAGRGIGELPSLQRSQFMQLLAPFQVEVGNAAWVLKDMAGGEKALSKIAKFMVASYMFNRITENIKGTPVIFDPIQAIYEGVKIAANEDLGVTERIVGSVGRLGGEALSNVPFGQTAALLYPEYGGSIPGTDIRLPTRKKVFGTNDPTRFGSGLFTLDMIKDWPYKLLPPVGGMQLKKTLKGAEALIEEELSFGKEKIYMERTPENIAKGLLFGPYSTDEAKEKYKEREKTK